MKSTKAFVVTVAVCLALALTGCIQTNPWESLGNGNQNVAQLVPGMNHQNSEFPYTFEYASEEDSMMRQGKLIVTVNRCWTVTNEKDFPAGGGIIIDEVTAVVFQNFHEDGTYEMLWYPEDIVQDDGSFASDAYFVMIELTYTNVDAARWICDDLDEKGEQRGMFLDPYVFDIIGGLQYPDSQGPDTSPDYFSELNEVDDVMESSLQFYLKPGETRTITVGFLVRENRDTCLPYKLSDLSYRISLDGGHTQVYLPLGG